MKDVINKLLNYSGLSAAEFSRKIGLDRPQAIYDILKGKTKSISVSMKDKIISVYPEIDTYWLLTGNGEMIQGREVEAMPETTIVARGKEGQGKSIRYWQDVDATAGGVTLYDDELSDRYVDMQIPEFGDCTDAVNLYGESMTPLYKSGTIIILKEWKESFIDYGNVYLVITKNGNRMVKYLKKGEDDMHLLCESENRDYEPFQIERGDVHKLYIVKGSISKTVM